MTTTFVHPLIEAARREAKQFWPTLAKTAYARGLAVTQKDGSTRPIPVTATPIVVSKAELQRRVGLSVALCSAATKMARAVLSGSAADLLLGALSPLERRYAERMGRSLRRLATARVDFFVSDRPWALEVNATIPAMQAYSDIAADAFIEALGRQAGLSDDPIARLQAQNGSNSLALYRALLDSYALERSGTPRTLALLCRRNDAQLTEQQALAEKFRGYGADADVVHPDELSGTDAVRARGKTYDLIYRHVFVRRLEELQIPYVTELLGELPSPRAVVVNPPASQIEVKATFGLLSQAAHEPDLARSAELTDAEVSAILESVPWTRPFRHSPAVGPDGGQVADLVDFVAAHPERFVVKRSWDYGGKAVFVGSSVGESSFDERVRAAYGRSMAWPELCARAAQDPVGGGFVAQQLVDAKPQKHLICSESGLMEAELHVDFSAYASVGLDRQPAWGGVCRGSVSQIVNILGGGGVLPLITSDVADSLLNALKAR
jgi:hypothetical protein